MIVVREENMKIVVSTPTGHIGSRITQLLIQSGVRPTLLVRDPARLPEAVRAASDVKQGDLADAKFVAEATAGADALLWVIPSNYMSEDILGDIRQIGRNAADAIRKNGISRVVLLSSIGAELKNQSPIGALGEVEEMLNATGANVVSLRPGYFFTNLLSDVDSLSQGVFPINLPLDMPAPWNDPRDVADIAAARLLSQEWSGQHVHHIQGPQDLSFAQVAEVVSQTTGKAVTAVRVTDEEWKAAMVSAGLPESTADAFVEMSRGVEKSFGPEYARTYQSTAPTTLEGWAYANLRPVLA